MELKIIWSEDEHDCETCGANYSQGAIAYLDGVVIFNQPANAGCMSLVHVDTADVYEAALLHLGVVIQHADL